MRPSGQWMNMRQPGGRDYRNFKCLNIARMQLKWRFKLHFYYSVKINACSVKLVASTFI